MTARDQPSKVGRVSADPGCHHLPSGMRAVPPEVTLDAAQTLAPRIGITRVTNITRLDRIGVPVFTSVRPSASPGSLCVNAGKGLRLIDAQVGAYMEGIEYALAEPGATSVQVIDGKTADVLDAGVRTTAVLDLCPRIGEVLDPAGEMACVEAEELLVGGTTAVPAELVFLPYVGRKGTGHYGSNSNGLASGNTATEATVHALLEVIERDVRSFHNIDDRSQLIDPLTLPERIQEVLEAVRAADLDMCLRFLPNSFGVPCFEALLHDRWAANSLKLAAGYGCHLVAEVALVRAVTEAIQSRLSWIHGARDDLAEPEAQVGPRVSPELAAAAARQWEFYTDAKDATSYERIEALSVRVTTLSHALSATLELMRPARIQFVARVRFGHPEDGIQVVKVIVPRLEYFDRFSHRMGPRLHEFVRDGRS